ncbi:cupin domain-containing protein [Roseomonas hellenica]|uniref:Cupin domain-containing protein n=1 Tax=Plastoroseomonas hellenica TaxID=2687306 RepID=A0ABS5ET54_9PROT|nr:cupin domain-containing protein [Plastoroseomonas hellenica]MBR0663120.1 cupin domain-containing protein [Plastoroseomonas hellenica]
MRSRRFVIGCAVCAAVASLTATEAAAQATSGVTRTILQQTELPGGTHVVILVAAEVAPGAEVARHTHPGIESAYVLEGECTVQVAGSPDRVVGPGQGFQIPAETAHGVKNGPRATKLAITYTVEKGKPLASPA